MNIIATLVKQEDKYSIILSIEHKY